MSTSFDAVVAELRSVRGVDFSGYRPGVIERSVHARMRQNGARDLDEYCALLRRNAGELNALLDGMTINVSSFFRDPLVFELVSDRILPVIIDRKHREGSREIRVWSAGCAAGEEAYSLAILLCEALDKDRDRWQQVVFGTDVDRDALAAAGRAIYPRKQLEHAKQGILDRYFVPRGDGYEVEADASAMVRFSWDDLTSERLAAPADSVFGSFDLIFCRNVLIYFTPELQRRVVHKLCRALTPGGYLVLGAVEFLSQDAESFLQTVDGRCRIFRRSS